MNFKTYLRNRDLLFFLLTSLISYQILQSTDCLIDTVVYPYSHKYLFKEKDEKNIYGVSINLNKLLCLIFKVFIIVFIIYLFFNMFY